MAYLAACTNAGTRKQVNEDACCIEVAMTPLGEVLMAVVCDGVGGLSRGNVASSTVIDRFVNWFERELPALLEGMVAQHRFDFLLVQIVWETMLSNLNELIRTHGVNTGAKMGTTFTGVIACGGRYLIGHVGDCRVYRMDACTFEQLTEDQTLVAKRLAAGEITAEEARRAPKNVILQAVGSQRVVSPAFYEGTFTPNDLFVICCDGAYHRAENEGIRKLFQTLNYRDEAALSQACDTLLQFDMDCGEKDNLTAVCFSGDLASAGEVEKVAAQGRPATQGTPAAVGTTEDDLATMVDAGEGLGEDDLPTMVDSGEKEDDLVTMVAEEPEDEDDLATMVTGDDFDEDDLVTMVADDDSDEDDLATMVAEGPEDDLATMVADDDSDEDDLATMVADGPEDEDDLATMVADGPEDEDDLATMVADGPEDEDDLATMVANDDSDEDDLATMVADDDDWDDDEDDPFGDFDLDLPTFSPRATDEDEDEDEEPAWSSDVEDDALTMVVDEDDDLPTMVEGADA